MSAWGQEPQQNLLSNAGFEEGLNGWSVYKPAEVTMDTVLVGDDPAARIVVPAAQPIDWYHFYQNAAASPGDLLELHVMVKGTAIEDAYGAYCALNFYDGKGQRITWEQSSGLKGTFDWTELLVRAVAPEGTASVSVALLLYGHGEAFFDDAALYLAPDQPDEPPTGPVAVHVASETAAPAIIGFGFEDDGWFYNAENASHGVTREDWEIREERIRWMNPDFVRMFFWYKDWNPSGDWSTFDFETDNMQSHCRTLDLYQEIGAKVNVVGVEWGINAPYADIASAASAIGALLEHLVVEKGYSCIRYWTLTNEPNGAFLQQGADFAGFVELHQLVRQEFLLRGLDVQIVGSDDAQSLPWFADCVEDAEYYAAADLFSSHRYFPYASRELAAYFFDDRLSLLEAQPVPKPFIVGEFGFQDNRSGTLDNPLMEAYRYAVWTAEFLIRGLDRGVSGASIWCLHEVYYPGNGFMNYGLWNYKDRGWETRPVYHAIANFTRFTESGDSVLRCESSHPSYLRAVCVGPALFWVNPSEEAVGVQVSGFEPVLFRVMTESTVSGDREAGYEAERTGEVYAVPGMSFGYALSRGIADVDRSGALNAVDVQLVINAVLGLPAACNCDVDRNGALNATDVQRVINAVLRLF